MCANLNWLISFASIFGLVQSILWMGFGITGALTYLCVIPVDPYKDKSDFFRVTFVKLYFEGPGCIPDGEYLGEFNKDYREVIDLFTPDRVFAVMVSYVILNAVYFIVSFIFFKNRKEQHKRPLVAGWSTLTLVLCAIDIVFTYEVILDIFALINYMNPDQSELGEVYTSSAKGTLGEIPYISLVLSLISSRLVVFWVWNFVIGAFFFFDALCCRKGLPKVKPNKNKNDKNKEILEELRQRADYQQHVRPLNEKYINAFDCRRNQDFEIDKRSMEAVTKFSSVSNDIGNPNWGRTSSQDIYWQTKPQSSKNWEMTNEGFLNDEPNEPEKELDFDHNLKNFEAGEKKIKFVKPPIGKPVISEADGGSSST